MTPAPRRTTQSPLVYSTCPCCGTTMPTSRRSMQARRSQCSLLVNSRVVLPSLSSTSRGPQSLPTPGHRRVPLEGSVEESSEAFLVLAVVCPTPEAMETKAVAPNVVRDFRRVAVKERKHHGLHQYDELFILTSLKNAPWLLPPVVQKVCDLLVGDVSRHLHQFCGQ